MADWECDSEQWTLTMRCCNVVGLPPFPPGLCCHAKIIPKFAVINSSARMEFARLSDFARHSFNHPTHFSFDLTFHLLVLVAQTSILHPRLRFSILPGEHGIRDGNPKAQTPKAILNDFTTRSPPLRESRSLVGWQWALTIPGNVCQRSRSRCSRPRRRPGSDGRPVKNPA